MTLYYRPTSCKCGFSLDFSWDNCPNCQGKSSTDPAPTPLAGRQKRTEPPAGWRTALLRRYWVHELLGGPQETRGRVHPAPVTGDVDELLRAHAEGVPTFATFATGKVKRGAHRLSAYSLRGDHTTRWVCLDVDAHGRDDNPRDPLEAVRAWGRALDAHGIPHYEERSAGGGWHVWTLLDEPTDAAVVRRLFRALLPEVPRADGAAGPATLELFPKAARRTGKAGTGVWLPWWHAAQHGRTVVGRLDDAGEVVPLEEGTTTLATLGLAELLRLAELVAPEAPVVPRRAATSALPRSAPRTEAAMDGEEPWARWKREALARVDLRAVYGALLTGRRTSNGLEARAFGRADVHPSCVVFEETGGHYDSGDGDGTHTSLLDALVRLGLAADFSAAVRWVADHTGIQPPVGRVAALVTDLHASARRALPPEEAAAAVAKYTRRALDEAGRGRLQVVRAGCGLGKTTALRAALGDADHHWVVTPTHRLAGETVAAVAGEHRTIHARSALYVLDEHGAPKCARPHELRAAMRAGVSGPAYCARCPSSTGCEARAEAGRWADPEAPYLATLGPEPARVVALAQQSGVRYLAELRARWEVARAAEAAQQRTLDGGASPGWRTKHVVWLDERVPATLDVTLPADGWRALAAAVGQLEAPGDWAGALARLADARGAPVPLATLWEGLELPAPTLSAAAADAVVAALGGAPGELAGRTHEHLDAQDEEPEAPAGLALLRALHEAHEGGGRYTPHDRAVTALAPLWREVRALLALGVTVIQLDATADLGELAAVAGVQVDDLDVWADVVGLDRVAGWRRTAILTSNTDKRRALRHGRTPNGDKLRGPFRAAVAELRELVAGATTPPRVVVYAHKALADAGRAVTGPDGRVTGPRPDWLPEDAWATLAKCEVRWSHYHSTRGINEEAGAAALLALGAPRPNLDAVRRAAEVLGVADVDDYARRLTRAELTQVVHRLRPVRAPSPGVVVVVGSELPDDPCWTLGAAGVARRSLEAVEDEARGAPAPGLEWVTGRWAHDARVTAGWTQRRLAEAVGASERTVRGWEAGDAPLPARWATQVRDALAAARPANAAYTYRDPEGVAKHRLPVASPGLPALDAVPPSLGGGPPTTPRWELLVARPVADLRTMLRFLGAGGRATLAVDEALLRLSLDPARYDGATLADMLDGDAGDAGPLSVPATTGGVCPPRDRPA